MSWLWVRTYMRAAPSFETKFAETNAAYKDLPTIGNIAKGDVTVENCSRKSRTSWS